MDQSYIPQCIWRIIGLMLLDQNDMHVFHSFCLACHDTMQAVEHEFDDLFGKAMPHLNFRSRYLMDKLCVPFVDRLRHLVHNMLTAPVHTTMWLNGGVGNIEHTILEVTNHINNRVVIHCNERGKSLRLQRSRRHKPEPPLFLILLGCDQTALTTSHVMGWVVNQRGLKATVIFVSQHTVMGSPLVTCNMDNILCIDGILVSEQLHEQYEKLCMMMWCGNMPPAT